MNKRGNKNFNQSIFSNTIKATPFFNVKNTKLLRYTTSNNTELMSMPSKLKKVWKVMWDIYLSQKKKFLWCQMEVKTQKKSVCPVTLSLTRQTDPSSLPDRNEVQLNRKAISSVHLGSFLPSLMHQPLSAQRMLHRGRHSILRTGIWSIRHSSTKPNVSLAPEPSPAEEVEKSRGGKTI